MKKNEEISHIPEINIKLNLTVKEKMRYLLK